MSPRESILYGLNCNSPAGLVLYDVRFQKTVKTILKFAIKFEIGYGIEFLLARSQDIADDLHASNFLHYGRLISCLRHVRLSNFLLCYRPAFSKSERKRLLSLASLVCRTIRF